MTPLYKKLKTVMYANDTDQKTLCKVIDRSQTYMTLRMTGKSQFDLEDAYRICEYLHIPIEQLSEYFPRGGKGAPSIINSKKCHSGER